MLRFLLRLKLLSSCIEGLLMVALGIVGTGQELYDALLTLRMIEPEQVSNVCIHRWALGRLGGMVQGTYDSP